MKRVERLGEAVAPDGSLLGLYRHDRDYVIRVDGQELFSHRDDPDRELLMTVLVFDVPREDDSAVSARD